jgi:cell division septation protein DedD
MTTATSEDTEITLGTGKMLLLFFGLVALCAVFFATGFSIGRKSALSAPLDVSAVTTTASSSNRPSAVKAQPAPTTVSASEKADTTSAPSDQQAAAPTGSTAENVSDHSVVPLEPATAATGGYFVQVAAVSKEEDAAALVDALKRKQYPAFSANIPPDKLFHVQVGPYAEIKDAEAMRAKLVSDGYNPILKK